ncbi:MAG TPA: ornithine cyclodeaminase family protein [Ilumatobacteraceae bacterium]|nr:ornithine cyclodeaminase family protein [Ilumatobacteraceae bacterium]HRB03070.1 ornithine cyclodeaminase family protein [Ilumatobacteraceae bacterium]
MGEILVLSRDDVSRSLDLAGLREQLTQAFVAFSDGTTSVPPRMAASAPDGFLGAMPGFVPGVGFGLKAVTVFAGNHGTGIPSHQGLIALFDPSNGSPVAVMDASLITEVRTALSAAMGVDLGARRDATSLAVIGAGALGHEHMRVLQGIRPWADIRIASRTHAHAKALAAQYPGSRAAAGFEEAVRGADVVCLCTDAESSVIEHEWLAAGVHVSSVGRGAEIPAATVSAAMTHGVVIVEWRGAAVNAPPAGAHELQDHDPAAMVEMGEILSGRAVGRTSDTELTVYKSTGHAIEDLAAARLVLDSALASGLGTRASI